MGSLWNGNITINMKTVHVYCPSSLRLNLLIVRMLVSVRSAINTLVREGSSADPLGPVQLHENWPLLATVQLTSTEETRLPPPKSTSPPPGKNAILLLVMLTKKQKAHFGNSTVGCKTIV